jgi:WD40 repeat protein
MRFLCPHLRPSGIFAPRRPGPDAAINENADKASLSTWKNLPDDLLESVFTHLTPKDLARAGAATPAWAPAANAPALWQRHAQSLKLPTAGSVPELKASCRHSLVTEANLLAGRGTSTKIITPNGRSSASAWSPDGRQLAFTLQGYVVWVIDVATDTKTALPCLGDSVRRLAWSPNSRQLACALRDDMMRVVDVATGTETATIDLGPVYGNLAWSPGGSHIAWLSRNNTVRIADLIAKTETALLYHGARVKHVAWSPDGRQLASVLEGSTVRIHAVDTGVETARLRYETSVMRVGWSLDGRQIASSTVDDIMHITDIATGVEAAYIELCSKSSNYAWSPTFRHVAAISSQSSTVEIIAVGTGIVSVKLMYSRRIRRVEWSADGSRMASFAVDGSVGIIQFGPLDPNDCVNKTQVWTAVASMARRTSKRLFGCWMS